MNDDARPDDGLDGGRPQRLSASGEVHAFWLMTKGERAIKGEGRSDADALNEIRRRLGIPIPSLR